MATSQLLLPRKTRQLKVSPRRQQPQGPERVIVIDRTTTEAMLRDMAFVLQATRSIKAAILSSQSPAQVKN